MSLLKSEIKKIIKKDLGDFLKKYGYQFNAKAGGFLRYFERGFDMVGVAIFDYRPKFKISPFFIIRFDEVENIVQKHVFVLEEYKDIAYTINTGMEYFTGANEYEIRTEEELYKLLSLIKDVYTSKVDAFLKHYSDIGNIDKALNDERINLNKLIEPDNCIRSLIIARLNKNPRFVDIAKEYYERYIKEYYLDTEDGPNRITETVNYLNGLKL